jgi:glycerol-3-phosphate acyltransferase PlsX
MSGEYRIALDAMGGDHGLSVVVPAALEALKQHTDIALVLVGDEALIKAALEQHKAAPSENLKIHHASQVVQMDESPAIALKNKKDSSMRVAINLVKAGEADAAVSAGNTGALMATARFVLKTLPGIDRPAICTILPAVNGHTHMLDLGANVDSEAEHLYQFALMGSELVKAIDDNPNPRVGLLNIGQEAIKGNEQVKAANALLQGSPLNYIGYVEGDDIYHGDVDVVVCDGFVGNVALKTSEGLAKMVSAQIKKEYTANLFTRLAALISMPVLKSFRLKFDPRRYNGASLLGLQGIVVKSHGGADSLAYANAIGIARTEIIKQVPQRIRKQLEHLLAQRQKA